MVIHIHHMYTIIRENFIVRENFLHKNSLTYTVNIWHTYVLEVDKNIITQQHKILRMKLTQIMIYVLQPSIIIMIHVHVRKRCVSQHTSASSVADEIMRWRSSLFFMIYNACNKRDM